MDYTISHFKITVWTPADPDSSGDIRDLTKHDTLQEARLTAQDVPLKDGERICIDAIDRQGRTQARYDAPRVEYDIKDRDRIVVAEGLSKDEALAYLDEHGAELKTVTVWKGAEVSSQVYGPTFLQEGGVPDEHNPSTDGRLAALRNREHRQSA